MSNAKSILVIRNDKLGDFMLAWPAFALLKSQYPDSEITALVTAYTKDMADLCPSIDKTLVDEGNSVFLLSRAITKYKFDASVALFTETRTALACLLSRIPVRVAPATKFAQLFSNKNLTQRRSRSEKPEYEYNIDLVKHLIKSQGDTPVTTPAPPYLFFDQSLVKNLLDRYRQDKNIPEDRLILIVHPGTGGSAINFSIEQYASLIKAVSKNIKSHFIITAGPGETETAQSLSTLIQGTDHHVYISDKGIETFSQFIAICDLFISGSTGPLHIAGALNVRTAAIYPARRSATALRWQTTNIESRRIAFSPDKHVDEHDMKTIDPKNCARQITLFLNQR